MSREHLKDVAHSVRQRLLNLARSSGRPFNDLAMYYAAERFLYRFSRTGHVHKFVLKGALMLRVWRAPVMRATKDIDLLGLTDNSVDRIVAAVRDACRKTVEPDGMDFDAGSVTGSVIGRGAEYRGVRVRLAGHMGKAIFSLQIDVGFGDAVIPAPRRVEYPVILNFPAPRLYGYSRESAIAEKFHAMVQQDVLNSRVKDFFDIWLLSRQFDFEGRQLAEAIAGTFKTRGVAVPAEPVAFTTGFAASREAQWKAFLRKSRPEEAPESFADAAAAVARFLGPVVKALAAGEPFARSWPAPGPWR